MKRRWLVAFVAALVISVAGASTTFAEGHGMIRSTDVEQPSESHGMIR